MISTSQGHPFLSLFRPSSPYQSEPPASSPGHLNSLAMDFFASTHNPLQFALHTAAEWTWKGKSNYGTPLFTIFQWCFFAHRKKKCKFLTWPVSPGWLHFCLSLLLPPHHSPLFPHSTFRLFCECARTRRPQDTGILHLLGMFQH